jgi:hypothetical protein
MTLAIGAVLLIAGFGMTFAALPNREGLPCFFLSGNVEIFYVVISIARMTFGIAMIISGSYRAPDRFHRPPLGTQPSGGSEVVESVG